MEPRLNSLLRYGPHQRRAELLQDIIDST